MKGENMVNEFNAIIGQRISKLRVAKGWTREEAAFQALMSPKHLYEVESGRKSISVEKLVNLAKAFDVSCDYLILGDSEENG